MSKKLFTSLTNSQNTTTGKIIISNANTNTQPIIDSMTKLFISTIAPLATDAVVDNALKERLNDRKQFENVKGSKEKTIKGFKDPAYWKEKIFTDTTKERKCPVSFLFKRD